MSNTRLTLIIVLTIIAVALIGLQRTDKDEQTTTVTDSREIYPNYQSQYMVTLAYQPTGRLGYKLVADNVDHFADLKETLFTNPVMTIYDENIQPLWLITAEKGRLTNSRQLYLIGHVEVNNLSTTSQLQRIVTQDAYIDLVSQNIQSDNRVDLYSTQIHSSGDKLKGNLREKFAELIGNTVTDYVPQSTIITQE